MEEPNILIKHALNDAVNFVNAGESPTEALAKVAASHDLNPNYVHRVGEALNVALHYNHFKTASDRSTEFPVADIEKVARENIMPQVKTAAEFTSEHFSSNEGEAPAFNFRRMQSNLAYKQAYLQVTNATETNDSYPTSLSGLFDKSANHITKLERDLDEANTKKAGAEFALNTAFSKLANHFHKDENYRGAFHELESQAFSKYGSAADEYVELLYKTAGVDEERGSKKASYIMFEPSNELAMFDSLMKAANDFTEANLAAKEAAEGLEFERNYMQDIRHAVGALAKSAGLPARRILPGDPDTVNPHLPAPTPTPVPPVVPVRRILPGDPDTVNPHLPKQGEEDPVLAYIKKKDLAAKTAAVEKEGFISETLGSLDGMLDKVIESQTTSLLKSYTGDSATPEHKPRNSTLENMERKLILQELLLTDPILSKVPPAKVARAYEQLLRLAPQISKEKEIVRAELRGMCATQSLSKYDASLMTQLDTDMMKHQIGSHNFMTGRNESFKI